MSSVPEDLYLDILLRVPVKSTFTCKCVCKTWFSIISNPNFIKTHIQLTIQDKKTSLMLIGDRDGDDTVYSIRYDSLALLDAVEIDYPYKSLGSIELLGSCNGLVWIRSHNLKLFCIWNPATKEYKMLPNSPNKYEDDNICVYAFGYDWNNDDYKLINVVEYRRTVESNLVDIYTLRSNTWRSGKPAPYRFGDFRQDSGVLVNGVWHWIGRKCDDDNNSMLIISLDINNEKFEELPLTEEFENKDFSMTIGVLKESLCAFFDVGDGFEVWMMQEYGVRESWTKCFVIAHDKIKSNCYFRVFGSLNSSEILLLSKSKFVLYDSKDGSSRKHSLSGEAFYDGLIYFESLVSLDSGSYVGVDDQIKKKMKRKWKW